MPCLCFTPLLIPAASFIYINMKATALSIPHFLEERPGVPLFLHQVAAGWPSPAEDYIEGTLDLHKYAVRNEAATFFFRASGPSMQGAGIFDGDILVVDRSREATSGKVVIAAVEGELTVKRLLRERGERGEYGEGGKGGRVLLVPENPEFLPLDITHQEDAYIWGVVTYVLHAL